jgi:hypothetical protein
MKVFKFEERVKTIVTNYYEIFAETEEEALELVQQGHGFQESFTHDLSAPGEFELYDEEEIPEK